MPVIHGPAPAPLSPKILARLLCFLCSQYHLRTNYPSVVHLPTAKRGENSLRTFIGQGLFAWAFPLYLAIQKVSRRFCAQIGADKRRASGDFLNGLVQRAQSVLEYRYSSTVL